MSTKANYSQTYWNHKGKHEEIQAALQKLVPDSGEVPNADLHPALETFRIASNCYYDLYNNGLCNRGQEFAEVFDISGLYGDKVELTQELIDRTESKMDEIILAAYAEQFPTEKTFIGTIDITPAGCQTPEGNARVVKTQQEWDSATHELANALREALDGYVYGEGFCGDELHQIKALVGARDRKQEASLQQELERQRHLRIRQVAIKQALVRLRVCPFAGEATEPAKAVAMHPEPLAASAACFAVHTGLDFRVHE